MDSPIAVSPNGQTVYVVEGDSLIDAVNTRTYRADSTIAIKRNTFDLQTIAISSDGETLYGVTAFGSGPGYTNESFLYVVDLRTHAVTASLSSGQLLTDVVSNPHLPLVYVTHLGGTSDVLTVEALNTAGKRERSFSTGDGSSGMAVSTDGATAYLATQENGVMVLNAATLTPIATISNGSFGFGAPGSVTVSSNGRRLCVLEGRELGLVSSNKVWIVNLRPFRHG